METGGAEASVDNFIEFLAEWGLRVRKRQRGLMLTTAHRAKGLEFDHMVVLDGGWDRVGRREDADATRRLYYVAMTRTRQTLTLARLPGPHPIQDPLQNIQSMLHRKADFDLPKPCPKFTHHHVRLGLKSVFLSFAGYREARHPVHSALATLPSGDALGSGSNQIGGIS